VTTSRDHTDRPGEVRDELIQKLLDDELDLREAREARELLASDPELRRDAEAYQRLGDLIRMAAGTEERDASEAWEQVEQGLSRPAGDPTDPGMARVWLGEFMRHRKRFWIPAAGAMAAAAAALVVALAIQPVTPPPIPIDTTQAVELRSRVTDISLHSTRTLVMEVETSTGGTAAILWVTEGDEEELEEDATDGSSD
jgi:anti-sigma factor RsiW